MMNPVLTIDDISVAYQGATTLFNVSMDLYAGKVVGIVGESGSGKSTLLRAIVGLLQTGGEVIDGSIKLLGKDIYRISDDERRKMVGKDIAILFQQPGMYFNPTRKLGKQYQDFLYAHGETSSSWREIALRELQNAGFEDGERILNSYAFELSGGMRQRVAAAMTFTFRPVVLLVDEPTSAIDTISTIRVLNHLHQMVDSGTAMIFVTHHIHAAGYIADDILVMKNGRVVERGSSKSVLKKPQHPYTQQLLHAISGVK